MFYLHTKRGFHPRSKLGQALVEYDVAPRAPKYICT